MSSDLPLSCIYSSRLRCKLPLDHNFEVLDLGKNSFRIRHRKPAPPSSPFVVNEECWARDQDGEFARTTVVKVLPGGRLLVKSQNKDDHKEKEITIDGVLKLAEHATKPPPGSTRPSVEHTFEVVAASDEEKHAWVSDIEQCLKAAAEARLGQSQMLAPYCCLQNDISLDYYEIDDEQIHWKTGETLRYHCVICSRVFSLFRSRNICTRCGDSCCGFTFGCSGFRVLHGALPSLVCKKCLDQPKDEDYLPALSPDAGKLGRKATRDQQNRKASSPPRGKASSPPRQHT